MPAALKSSSTSAGGQQQPLKGQRLRGARDVVADDLIHERREVCRLRLRSRTEDGDACGAAEDEQRVHHGDVLAVGDAQPVDLVCFVDDGPKGLEVNEYVTAQRFIGEQFERLNNNYLEEIARKVRGATEPLLETVKRLRSAMEAQN